MDDSLPDEQWKDSFDKLLETKSVLRAKNILKPSVRVSYNMDSSYENSSASLISCGSPVTVRRSYGLKEITTKSISTPIGKVLSCNNFNCSISPIGAWKILYFDKTNKNNRPELQKKLESSMECHNYLKKENIEKSICGITPVPKKSRRRQVYFESEKKMHEPVKNTSVICLDLTDKQNEGELSFQIDHEEFVPPPGKWRKSLCVWRRKHANADERRSSEQPKGLSVKNTIIGVAPIICHRKSIFIDDKVDTNERKETDYRTQTLQLCKQEFPIDFDELYSSSKMQYSRKIGEGVFGEVFLYSNSKIKKGFHKNDKILKIIPIEGLQVINGEAQKTFELIVPEIVIATELSSLRNGTNLGNKTSGFVEIEKVSCVKGKYPKHFIELWESFDEEKGSDNDHPKVFKNEQLYIILEQAYAGKDLATFEFHNADQSYHIFLQIVFALAVAEEVYQFEHRDLHWGNVLISTTTAKTVQYKLQGENITIPSRGLKATIIDYTLSRMSHNNCCFYNDLSTDEELFEASGDYQFEIYRMMKNLLHNKWDVYNPKTNIFWISYVIAKIISGVPYKNTRTKAHISYMDKLLAIQDKVLDFGSTVECAKYLYKNYL